MFLEILICFISLISIKSRNAQYVWKHGLSYKTDKVLQLLITSVQDALVTRTTLKSFLKKIT